MFEAVTGPDHDARAITARAPTIRDGRGHDLDADGAQSRERAPHTSMRVDSQSVMSEAVADSTTNVHAITTSAPILIDEGRGHELDGDTTESEASMQATAPTTSPDARDPSSSANGGSESATASATSGSSLAAHAIAAGARLAGDDDVDREHDGESVERDSPVRTVPPVNSSQQLTHKLLVAFDFCASLSLSRLLFRHFFVM